MKRFHVHVSVDDLAKNIRFYSALFAQEATLVKEDYAKWMLNDPRINFAISRRGSPAGINHLGLQVEGDEELSEIHARLEKAEGQIVSEEGGKLLLRPVGQTLDHRSPRHCLGNLPVSWQRAALQWRGTRREYERHGRGVRLLRAGSGGAGSRPNRGQGS